MGIIVTRNRDGSMPSTFYAKARRREGAKARRRWTPGQALGDEERGGSTARRTAAASPVTGTGAADLAEVARAPIVGAQRPAGLKRQRHHLLDPLGADRISEERGAEQAVGQAGDEGGHSPVRTALCLASTVFSVECLLAHARVNDKLDKCDNGRNESPAENQIEQAPTGSPQIKLVGTESA